MNTQRTKWGAMPFVAVNVAGVLAFAMPFFLSAPQTQESSARSSDSVWLMVLLTAMLIAVALSEAAGGKMDSKAVALLGVLAALAAVMRIPISLAGANLVYLIPIVAGYVFGSSFGFVLGATAMLVSAGITGFIGPWVPFQMWAMGWVGAGAGLLRPLGGRPRAGIAALAIYGYAAALFYGAVMNLYSWPLVANPSEIGWAPGLGLAETVRHYRSFYLLTSLAWDAFGGVVNVIGILILGAPLTALLARYRDRFLVEWTSP